jgi:hypothetical protein
MNRGRRPDDGHVTQFLNLVSSSVLTYAIVTRGGMTVARGLELLTRRSG